MVAPHLLQQDILTLGMQADEARRAMVGARVRYQRVHVVDAADVRDGLTIPEHASEVRVLLTPSTLEEAERFARAIKQAAGRKPVRAFSLADISDRTATWGDLREVLTRIAACGVADVAEVPVDRLDDLAAAVAIARSAGLAVSRLTVERPLDADTLKVLERIASAVPLGGIERVAPLPREAPADKPTTGYGDVRMVALTRLAVHEVYAATGLSVAVEVDWLRYGPKLAQVALTFGADFLDAVPATSEESLGRRRATVEDIERNIRAAGFDPEEYRPAAEHHPQPASEKRGS